MHDCLSEINLIATLIQKSAKLSAVKPFVKIDYLPFPPFRCLIIQQAMIQLSITHYRYDEFATEKPNLWI